MIDIVFFTLVSLGIFVVLPLWLIAVKYNCYTWPEVWRVLSARIPQARVVRKGK